MGQGTLGKVLDWSEDPRGDWDDSGDPRGGLGRLEDSPGDPGQVGGFLRRSGTGQGTLRGVWAWSGYPHGGPGWVG